MRIRAIKCLHKFKKGAKRGKICNQITVPKTSAPFRCGKCFSKLGADFDIVFIEVNKEVREVR